MCIRDRYNVGQPFERIAIDIAGPFPSTDDGNRYIMVVGDYFTKWVEAYAIPNQDVTTVAKQLVHNFCCRYGAPMEIHTDQGRHFESGAVSYTHLDVYKRQVVYCNIEECCLLKNIV